MPNKSVFRNNKVLEALPQTVITANGDSVGPIIDSKGFEGISFFTHAGTLAATTGVFTPKIEMGDDPALSDAEEVPDNLLDGTEAEALHNFDDDNEVKGVRVRNGNTKRFFRLTVVVTGLSGGNNDFSALAVLEQAETKPDDQNA